MIPALCPHHPLEPLRRFGDRVVCSACGELVYVGPDLQDRAMEAIRKNQAALEAQLSTLKAGGARFVQVRFSVDGAGRGLAEVVPVRDPITRPPRPARRAVAAWLRRLAERIDP